MTEKGRILLLVLILCPMLARAQLDLANERPQNLDDCDRLVQNHPKELEAYRCYWAVALQKNLAEEAYQRLERLLGADPENPRIHYYLGNLSINAAQFKQAEHFERFAVKGFQAEGEHRAEAFARLALVYLLERTNRTDEAQAQLHKAQLAAEESGYLDARAEVELRKGWQAYRVHDYGLASNLFKQIERMVFSEQMEKPELGGPKASRLKVRSDDLSGLGAICWATGRYRQAMRYYRRQADLLHESGAVFDEVAPRYNMALMAFNSPLSRDLGWEEKGRLIRDTLEASVVVGNEWVECKSRLLLAQLLGEKSRNQGSSDFSEAIRQLKRVLSLSQKLDRKDETSISLRRLGHFTYDQDPGKVDEAFGYLDNAIRLDRESGNLRELIWALRDRFLLNAKAGRRQRALDAAYATVASIEKLRNLQADDLVRARTFSRFSPAYVELFHYLLYSDEPESFALRRPEGPLPPETYEAAFEVIERMRSRVLLDELDAAGAMAELVPKSDLSKERDELFKQVSQAQRRLLRDKLTTGQRRELIRKVDNLEVEVERVSDAIARENSTFAQLRKPTFPSLRDLQRVLQLNEALLSFQLRRRETSRGLVITRNRVRSFPVPSQSDLETPMKLFLGLLERRDGSETIGAGSLYRDILKQAIDDLPHQINHLIIIPHTILHRLPWEALAEQPGEPILQRFRVTVVPSATLWMRLREETVPGGNRPVLALADPTPPRMKGAPEKAGTVTRSWAIQGDLRMSTLPYAREEAGAIAKYLGRNNQVFTGDQATESLVKQSNLRSYRIVHFAAHSVIHDEQPSRTAILLAPGSGNEDGLLQVREIVQLDLSGSVAVLSACSSASGELLGGEGMMGLSRAFFQAGSQAVVGSLQPLRDDEAARLFDRFYRHLAGGLSIAAALHESQLDLMEAGFPVASWASVLLMGDGSWVLFPGGLSPPYSILQILGLVAAALLVGALVLRLLR